MSPSAVAAVALAAALVLSVVSPVLAVSAAGEQQIDGRLINSSTTGSAVDLTKTVELTETVTETTDSDSDDSDDSDDSNNADSSADADNSDDSGDSNNADGSADAADSDGSDDSNDADGSDDPGDSNDADSSDDSDGSGDTNNSDDADDANDANDANNADNTDDANDSDDADDADDDPETEIDNESDPPQHANVTVRNASANESVTLNVSEANTGDVGVSTLNLTATKNASYEVNVTVSETEFDDGPAYTRSDGGVDLGSIRVNHTIADENISNVTFTFSLSEQRLQQANATPEEVALYRFHNGTWNELETEFLREENGSYVFRATSPGLSDFTAAAQKPEFELTKALVDPENATVGEEVDVRVRIHNVGDADGSYTAKLLFDGEVIATKQVTIAADGTRQVSFSRVLKKSGTYEVKVNNESAGLLAVESVSTTASATTTDTPMPRTSSVSRTDVTTESGPGFESMATIATLAAVVLFRRL